MHAIEALVSTLKKQIIEELAIEDMTEDDIDADEGLFGAGLGLDSIDALSLVVILDKEYGIQIGDPEEGKRILFSIRTIAEHILNHTSPAANQ
jgi:acyl carrier protein